MFALRNNLIAGLPGGPNLRRVEAAWAKLSNEEQNEERDLWLSVAGTAATNDNLVYEINGETLFVCRR